MNEDIEQKLKYLKITGLAEKWDELVGDADEQQMSPPLFLKHIVDKLYEIRMQRARSLRLSAAKIPDLWVMATYPFAEQPKLNKRRIVTLHDSLEYMDKKQNILLIGPTGAGKTGLGTGFLIQAITAGHRGRFITFPALIDELNKSIAAHTEARVLRSFASYDCLLIDELGYVEIDPAQVGLFFRLMTMRHRSKTTIITTNLGFQEWGTFLKNQQLTAALLDRLTENAHVINMRHCKSIRPKAAYTDNPTQPTDPS